MASLRNEFGRWATLAQEGARMGASRAAVYLRDPRLGRVLLDEALAKLRTSVPGPLRGVLDSLLAVLRMARAYFAGRYLLVPMRTMLWAVGAIVYFVMPVDLVPDFIAGLGFVDDAAVIGWVVRAIRADLEAFLAWERAQPLPPIEGQCEPAGSAAPSAAGGAMVTSAAAGARPNTRLRHKLRSSNQT